MSEGNAKEVTVKEIRHAIRGAIAPVFTFVELSGPHITDSDLRTLHEAATRSLQKIKDLLNSKKMA